MAEEGRQNNQPYPFHQYSSQFLAPTLAETGRERRSVGGISHAAVVLFQCLGPFSYHEFSVMVSVQVTSLDIRLVLLPIMARKYVVHSEKFVSLFRFVAPAGRDHAPNAVLQPSIPTWVRWTGWSFSKLDIGDHIILVTAIIWDYPREDLIITG